MAPDHDERRDAAGPGSNGRPTGVGVEARLERALAEADDYEPAPYLWQRVEASLADDRRRRRRRRRLALVLAALPVAIVVMVGRGGAPVGPSVDWRLVEVVETLVMLGIVVGVRPLLDDAGAEFLQAVFRGSADTADRFARLLDVAWNLVFVGMVVVTVSWTVPRPVAPPAAQLDQVLERIAGLLLAMGLLHGLTFLAMPLVGVAWMAATTGQKMPRWVAILLALGGVASALFLADLLIGLTVGAQG